ncbi:hypothetical protein FF1_032776 [Malus domestica]
MDPEEPVSKLEESVSKLTQVALQMTKHLLMSTEGKDNNIACLLVSIQVVLSMIAARTKGSTQDQLLSFLRAKSIDHLNEKFFIVTGTRVVHHVLSTSTPSPWISSLCLSQMNLPAGDLACPLPMAFGSTSLSPSNFLSKKWWTLFVRLLHKGSIPRPRLKKQELKLICGLKR